MSEIYAAAYVAKKPTQYGYKTETVAFRVAAKDRAEATELALAYAISEKSPAHGWYDHEVVLCHMPREWLLKHMANE